MKKIIISAALAIMAFSACEQYEPVKEVDTDFVRNYEKFWTLVDENYCFLGSKYNNDKNVDWQAVYDKWMPALRRTDSGHALDTHPRTVPARVQRPQGHPETCRAAFRGVTPHTSL